VCGEAKDKAFLDWYLRPNCLLIQHTWIRGVYLGHWMSKDVLFNLNTIILKANITLTLARWPADKECIDPHYLMPFIDAEAPSMQ
jgi:hypothetical protein